MGHTFECATCRRIKTEAVPYYGSGLMCEGCRGLLNLAPPTVEWRGRKPPPSAPSMRVPCPALTPSVGSLLVVLVFIAGVAVGAKMVGGW